MLIFRTNRLLQLQRPVGQVAGNNYPKKAKPHRHHPGADLGSPAENQS